MMCGRLLPLVLLVLLHMDAVGGLSNLGCIPVPEGKSYLPFQLDSIHGLARSPRILLADEMGLGKTISVIGALNLLQPALQRILIVAPKSVLPNWQWELQNWWLSCGQPVDGHGHNCTIGTATADKGVPAEAVNVLLINYDIVDKFKSELERTRWDVLVCDEAHFLKNREAMRTRAILGDLGAAPKRFPTRTRPLATDRLWLLTGSPLLNNPTELYTLLRSIDPHCSIIPELSSWECFSDRYSNKRIAPWGVTYQGGRNLSELRQRLRQIRPDTNTPLMIRRTKAEVLPDLPPKRHQLLPLWDQDGKAATGELQLVQTALQDLAQKLDHRSNTDNPKPKRGFEKKTLPQLKALLKENNLRVSGKKHELIERLRLHGVHEEINNEHQEGDATSTDDEDEADNPNSSAVLSEEAPNLFFNSAQSALRSQPITASDNTLLQDLMGMLYQNGENSTKSDNDSIRGLLAWARHETAKQKVPHAIELITEAISTHKVVVFAHHRDVQKELRDAFGNKAVSITGGDSLESRAEAVQRFQTDPTVRVFVGSIKAAGTGITLSAASHVIFVELDWSPLVVQQAEDRCHRVGQASSVLVQYLFFPDTIDAYLSQLLAAKQSTIAAAIDEAAGPANWVFDFGKHRGMSVGDVAGSDPSYLVWLVATTGRANLLERQPKLAAALCDLGFLQIDGKAKNHAASGNGLAAPVPFRLPTPNNTPIPLSPGGQGSRSTPGSYVMTFGKHKGKSLVDIPIGYLQWLRSSGATRRHPTMAFCLNQHLAERQPSRQRQ